MSTRGAGSPARPLLAPEPTHGGLSVSKKNLEAALDYASRGWHVYPIHTMINGRCSCPKGADCTDPAKHPVNAGGFNAAATDLAWIRKQFNGLANVGIATGEKAGLLV